jgi:hypothetical protein
MSLRPGMTMGISLRRLVLAGCLPLLAACGASDPDHALRQAHDEIAATLPVAHVEDLVIESVAIEGDALVQLVRSPAGNAINTRAHPRFDELRQAEQDEMRSFCALPAVQPLAATDVRLVRRFVDRENNLFFEIELRASECGTARAP